MGWDKHGTAGTYHRILKYTTTNDILSLAGTLPTATWHLDSVLERWWWGEDKLASPRLVVICFCSWVLVVVRVDACGWFWVVLIRLG